MLFRFWVFPDCTFLDISSTTNQALPQKQRFERTYSVCARLSDLNFGKMGFQTSVFPFHPQLFQVKCHGQEEQFCPDILFSPGKKTAESKVRFEQRKSSLYLDRTAHAQIDSTLSGNVFLRFGPLFPESLF